MTMNADLFLKRVPLVIKKLISREADLNHRSINQEAIALLEEALLTRAEAASRRQSAPHQTLARFAASIGDEQPRSDTEPRAAGLVVGNGHRPRAAASAPELAKAVVSLSRR